MIRLQNLKEILNPPLNKVGKTPGILQNDEALLTLPGFWQETWS